MKDITQSHTFRGLLIGLGGALVLLLIFQAGVFVGYKKASFSNRIGEQYFTRAFGPGMHGGGMMAPSEDLFGAHGAVGKVISVSLPTLTISGQDNTERTVRVATTTLVRQFREELTVKDLTVGDVVAIIGEPNSSGEVVAKLIRILPPPPDGYLPNSTTTRPRAK